MLFTHVVKLIRERMISNYRLSLIAVHKQFWAIYK